jgi:hypothetical protein
VFHCDSLPSHDCLNSQGGPLQVTLEEEVLDLTLPHCLYQQGVLDGLQVLQIPTLLFQREEVEHVEQSALQEELRNKDLEQEDQVRQTAEVQNSILFH